MNMAESATDPADKTKSKGTVGSESLNAPGRSNGGASRNFWPICSTTKSRTAGNILSGRKQRNMSIFWKVVNSKETSQDLPKIWAFNPYSESCLAISFDAAR